MINMYKSQKRNSRILFFESLNYLKRYQSVTPFLVSVYIFLERKMLLNNIYKS